MLAKEEIQRFAFFRWLKIRFKYTRFDKTETELIEQFVLDRGDSVGMLLHNVETDEIVLVEQVRIATFNVGTGWILELPAGRVDPGEDPVETARRESREEIGAEPEEVILIGSYFLSPGGCSERLHLYYCPYMTGLDIAKTGGLAEEHEDIRVHQMPLKEAVEMITSGRIVDAKTVIGLLWLNQQRLLALGES